MEPDFEAFWQKYPRRIAKKYARMIFAKTMRSGEVEFAHLMKAVEAYAKHVYGKPLQYVCHPSTWLAQGRWDDELEAPAEQQWTAADRWAQTVARMRQMQ